MVQYLAHAKTIGTDVPKRGEHHEKDLAKGTARLYYNTFVTALNEAVREGIIPENPTKLLKKEEKKLIGQGESRRCYLSIEEIRLLMATPCKDETVKQACLFIAYHDDSGWCGCSSNHGVYCGYYWQYGDCLSHTVGLLWGDWRVCTFETLWLFFGKEVVFAPPVPPLREGP